MKIEDQEKQSSYAFDGFVVEPASFRLSRDGSAVPLTPRAFDVLLYLIRHADRVVEKQEIFDAIWKDSFVTDDALIRAIKEIRRELGDDPASPKYIATVRKRGYRFIAPLESMVETDDAASPKVCPACRKEYSDVTLNYCLDDGMPLIEGRSEDSDATRILSAPPQHDQTSIVDPPSSSSGQSRLPFDLRVLVIALATLFVVGVAYVGFQSFAPTKTDAIRSLAVLPLVNESGNSEIEYLSDGITESLVGSLSAISGLEVKSRASVVRYKGTDVSAQDVGRDLNVEAVMVGRLIQRGEDIAIYLSLVDAGTENNIWSKQYIRKLANLIALENEIARDIAQILSEGLSTTDQQKLARKYPENVEAYQLYLKGRHHFLTTRHRGAEIAIEHYRKAIEIDPTYAKAYAAVVEASMGLAFRSEVPTTEVFTLARKDAEKALELDPLLPEAHRALGMINLWFDWDWHAGEVRYTRALELDPDDDLNHFSIGSLLCNTGRMEEGLAALDRARALNPLNLRNNAVYGQYLTFYGRPDEALAELRRVLELDPSFYLAHLAIAQAYLEKGSYAEAVAAAKNARTMNPQDSTPATFIAYGLAKQNRVAEANAVLTELLKLSDSRPVTPYNIAMVYNGLDDTENTLKWLNRAVDQRDLRLAFIKVEPKWNNLRNDPRFLEIVKRVGLL